MRKYLLFLPVLLYSCVLFSQDLSNKGKDFWVGYGSHVSMYNNAGGLTGTGGSQNLILYFASDVVANVTVTIPATGWTRNYTVIPPPAGTGLVESDIIPKTGADDARLGVEQKYLKKGVHITSDKPIVAYAHIYDGSISGATLLFPTNTLGKEYFSLNYTQKSNQKWAYPYVFVIATEDSTIIESTPAANTQNRTAGVTYRDTLMQGDILNLLGQITNGANSSTGVEMTGTRIKSIATATGQCKRIAVFSGSGKIDITCPAGTGGTADNYIQQCFPSTAWGQRFYTVPTQDLPNNYFRVLVKDQTTVVKLNGVVQGGMVAVGATSGYYDFPITNIPNLIETSLPAMVAQMITTQGACGNGSPGDPEMIYLSPIEQTIDKVTLNSTTHAAITKHYINVIIKASGLSSFLLDNAVPATVFTPHPQDPTYVYAQIPVSAGVHHLQSDSGFSAIAYGYGNAESYGYNAGTNLRDLYNFITPINPLNISNQTTACSGTPFYFSITYPYQPISLYWDFHGFQAPNVLVSTPVPDSTYFINGKQVWRYKLPTPYTYSPAGNYPVSITSGTTGSDGCGNTQVRDDTLYVFNPAHTVIGVIHNGCVTDSVAFKDSTVYDPTTFSYRWYWDFGDGSTDSVKNPKHKYLLPGTYTVHYHMLTNVGCYSDTATKVITVTLVPNAKFGVSSPICDGLPVTFSDSSIAYAPGTLVTWYWNNGDLTKDTLHSSADHNHTYTPYGNKTVTLKVETNSGCQSAVFSKSFYVGPIPFVNFNLPAVVCMPYDSAHFTDASTIADGSQGGFIYKWHFGEPISGGNDSSVLKNPAHHYSGAGPYNINLQVTSNVGCVHDTTKVLSTIYPQAHALFTVAPENCLNDVTSFTSNATGSGSNIAEYHWDFGDGTFSLLQNPTHTYATAGTKTIRHWIVTDKGCYSDTTTHTVIINPLPTANFNFNTPSCETKIISFTDASVANAGTLSTWAWSFGDPASGASNTSALQNPVHTFAAAGSYTVTLTVTSSKGCVSPLFSRQVTINPQPVPGFINPEVCLSDAFAQFLDTSHIASGTIVSWAWNFGDPAIGAANTSTLQNPQHRYNAIGLYTATLTVTSNSGCVATVSQQFTVNGDIPVSNFTPLNPATLCANDSVAIQDGSTVNFGNVTKVQIYWDNTGAPAVFQNDDNPFPGKIYKHLYPNFQSPLTKTFTIRYRAYSGATCVNDKIKTILVHAAPRVQFNAIPNICLDASPYQITQASETGGVPGTFVYSGPGVSATGLFNPATTGAGTFRILYTYTSAAGGCVDTASRTITVWAPPVANFGYTVPDCETKAISFSDSSSTPVGSLTTWTWDFGDGTPLVVRNTGAAFTHTFTSAGTYNVLLKVTTSNGCNSTVKQIAVVVKPQPRPSFTFDKTSYCLPTAIVGFNNTSSIADGTENSFTYLWDLGDPASGIANSSVAKNPAHSYFTTGPFNVRLQVTSGAGCIQDTMIALNTVHPEPRAKFIINKPSVCLGELVSFRDSSNAMDGTLTHWYWNYGDGNTGPDAPIVSYVYGATNTYTVSLYIVNSNGCNSDTVSKSFTVYPYPVVSAGPDRVVLEGGSVILQSVASGNDLQYLWTPNLYLNDNTIAAPTASNLLTDMTYTLFVTARGGCTKTDQVFVKLLKAPRIPNTFTPNNDGINDTWEIQYLNTYPNNRVQVFTRTGQLVFESYGYNKPWDGTLKGKPLPFDTYYYIIEPNNGRKPITGYVTILK